MIGGALVILALVLLVGAAQGFLGLSSVFGVSFPLVVAADFQFLGRGGHLHPRRGLALGGVRMDAELRGLPLRESLGRGLALPPRRGILLLAVVLLRVRPVVAGFLVAGFVAFVFVKEFYVDPLLEGASTASGWVDSGFYFLGAGIGAAGGFLRGPVQPLFLVAAIAVVVALLFAGTV